MHEKAHSAYAFVAVCDSARSQNTRPRAPRSGAANSQIFHTIRALVAKEKTLRRAKVDLRRRYAAHYVFIFNTVRYRTRLSTHKRYALFRILQHFAGEPTHALLRHKKITETGKSQSLQVTGYGWLFHLRSNN